MNYPQDFAFDFGIKFYDKKLKELVKNLKEHVKNNFK